MNVLVTGGAGYIASHAVLRLLTEGHQVTVVDNLVRGHRETIETLRAFGDLLFVEADIGDRPIVERVLRERRVELVMHFAAMAYVGESVLQPLRYYRANSAGMLSLLEAMDATGVNRLVFSSTCATYGEPPPERVPIREDCPQRPINPYGRSKLHGEQFVRDYASACAATGRPFHAVFLRYFNVAGADALGRIGEWHDPETHIIPLALQAALGRRAAFTIFGEDYPTPDGTCIRDYVHVEDLVDAHVRAMHQIDRLAPEEPAAFNVGIGRGYSVREVVDACQRVSHARFAVKSGARRPGDPPTLFADGSRIRHALGWSPRYVSLDQIIQTAWNWERRRAEVHV